MSKRIALIGNMNNNFFAITRYLRDLGYDAHLFYRLAMEHFQPKADTYSLDYTDYCHEVQWLSNGFHNVDESEVIQDLKGFDFYIGQSDEAAVANSCGFNMDVYYPYGTDVSKYAQLPPEYSSLSKLYSLFRSDKKNRATYSQMKKGTLAKYQRRVIVEAKYLLAEYTNEELTEHLYKLKFKGRFEKVPMPFIYLDEYDALNIGLIPDVHWKTEFESIRRENDFVVLYHGRQEWNTFYNKFTWKNTHHLIMGFADFVKQRPGIKTCLVMLEYGNDLQASKELISELGIDSYVKWLPKMYRKDIMYLLQNVDVCTGEFYMSYLTFGTIIEAMLMKRPVIHFRDDALYTDVYPELYPMLNAREPQEICKALNFAFDNPAKLKMMGEQAYSWVKKHFIEHPVKFLQNLIENN